MSKLILFAVVALLLMGLALNVLVATSCEIVQVEGSFAGAQQVTSLSTVISLGAFKYKEGSSTPTTTSSPIASTPTDEPQPSGSAAPSVSPSASPSFAPTEPGATPRPTNLPSISPTDSPTDLPSSIPTISPTNPPSIAPSYAPTEPDATPRPTAEPTISTPSPSRLPSSEPSPSPSSFPTQPEATPSPTLFPTVVPATPEPSQGFIPTPSTFAPTSFDNIISLAPTLNTTTGNSTNGNETFTLAPSSAEFGINFRQGQENTTTYLGVMEKPTQTRNSDTTPISIDIYNGYDFRLRRRLQEEDNDEGSCRAFGSVDNDDIYDAPVAKAGVIMAPVCGAMTLLIVLSIAMGFKCCPSKFATAAMWVGYVGCQIGMGLVWTLQQNYDEFCSDNDNCKWSKGAWMNVGAHICYAMAAFASCKLPGKKNDPQHDDDDFNSQMMDDYGNFPAANTVINTAMLDEPTVYDDGHQSNRKLEAELEAQKQAAAMEAGRAQAVAEQLEDQKAELADTREKLWEAQQEAQAEREKLAAAAALAGAATTMEAMRAKELEDRLQQQVSAMDQLEKRLEKAAADAMETGLAYYPAVWTWLGFQEPRDEEDIVPESEEGFKPEEELTMAELEEEPAEEVTGAYYPAVWAWLGFLEPQEPRKADPVGATAEELRMAKERKEQEALVHKEQAELETQQLRDELALHVKEIAEIKAAMRGQGYNRADPPSATPAVRNPDAAEPVGMRESELAAQSVAKEPRPDPQQVTRTDPANDPTGMRRSALQKGDSSKAPAFDPPIERNRDPANDPEELRRSELKEETKPSPANDPPIHRNPANDPEGLRRSSHQTEESPTNDPPIPTDPANDPAGLRSSANQSPMNDPPIPADPANDPSELRSSAVGEETPVHDPAIPTDPVNDPAAEPAVDTANQETTDATEEQMMRRKSQ